MLILVWAILVYPGLFLSLLINSLYFIIVYGLRRFILYRFILYSSLFTIVLLLTPVSPLFNEKALVLVCFYMVLVLIISSYRCNEKTEYVIWGIYNLFFNTILVSTAIIVNIDFYGFLLKYFILVFGLLVLYVINTNWFTCADQYYLFVLGFFVLSVLVYKYLDLAGIYNIVLSLVMTLSMILFKGYVSRKIYGKILSEKYNIILDKYLSYGSIVFVYAALISLLGYLL
jgi:hypothetical protein